MVTRSKTRYPLRMMERNEKTAQGEPVRDSFGRPMKGEAGLPFPEQVIRLLVLGLAVAYSYILLN